MMDAEHTMGIGEFYECVIPGPAEPARVCAELKAELGLGGPGCCTGVDAGFGLRVKVLNKKNRGML